HRAEISGARVPIVDRVASFVAGPLEVNRVVPGLAARGQLRYKSRGLDAGDGADLREKLVKEPFPVDRLRVEIASEVQVDGEDVAGVESFINLQQSVKAGAKKTGDDQQGRAQADFQADQSFAEAQAAAPFGDCVASGAKRFLRLVAGKTPGGEHADQKSREHD